MSVKFCVVAGASRRSLTCRMDVQSEWEDTPILLGAMGRPKYYIHTPKFLRKRIKVAEEMADDTPNILRNRIICNLAPVETVFCISFIPADPYTPQTLLVMRMKNPKETAESYPVYCFDFPAYKFMLPQERVEQVFDLSKLSIAQTVEQFDASLIPIFEKVLANLKREEKLKGMALTLTSQEGLKTYVWLKRL
jgi:hypothetical protein